MLKDTIQSTPLTTAQADSCFSGRIDGAEFRADKSLTAVARALFGNRIKDDEHIEIRLSTLPYGGNVDREQFRNFASELSSGCLHIVHMPMRTEDSGKWVEDARVVLNEQGLYPLEAVEKWLAQTPTVSVVYTDKPYDPKIPRSPVDNTKTLIVVENLTVARWHLLGALMPRFLGKWFQDMPRTQEETGLLNSLKEADDSALQKGLAAVAEQYDFRGATIRNLLGDFESKYAKHQIAALEGRCRTIDDEVNELSRRIGECLRDKDSALATLDGYRNQAPGSLEPVTMNFFLKNKNLYLQSATEDYLDFYVTAWLSNWDPAKAKNCFVDERCSGWLEYNNSFDVNKKDAIRLYKAIFVDETVRVKLWSHMKLQLRGDDAWQLYGDGCISDIQNALPNPHHHYNSCGGANRPYVNQCMIDRDIIGAMTQCMSATAGINLVEHASYQFFSRDLFDPAFGKVIYINEKQEFVTAKDAIQWLKEKDGSAKKAKAKKDGKEAK